MTSDERIRQTEALLLSRGWEVEAAREAATEANAEGTPLLEMLCFESTVAHVFAPAHDPSWITNRAENAESENQDLFRRLIDSGVSPQDLAKFARLMQREALSNLGCLLDGSGIYGTPPLPCEDFRIFAVNEESEPLAMIEDLHGALAIQDWETEMNLSRKVAESTGTDD